VTLDSLSAAVFLAVVLVQLVELDAQGPGVLVTVVEDLLLQLESHDVLLEVVVAAVDFGHPVLLLLWVDPRVHIAEYPWTIRIVDPPGLARVWDLLELLGRVEVPRVGAEQDIFRYCLTQVDDSIASALDTAGADHEVEVLELGEVRRMDRLDPRGRWRGQWTPEQEGRQRWEWSSSPQPPSAPSKAPHQLRGGGGGLHTLLGDRRRGGQSRTVPAELWPARDGSSPRGPSPQEDWTTEGLAADGVEMVLLLGLDLLLPLTVDGGLVLLQVAGQAKRLATVLTVEGPLLLVHGLHVAG